MANRNDSDARQHETLPGPGPGSSAASGSGGGVRPVEQMMDAAIERIAREQSNRDQNGRVPREQNVAELARRSSGEANLALRDAHPRVPTRLRWKGLDVSDEFREYAERIARGEELPPFEGRVLAEPNPAFPWDGAPLGEPEAVPKKHGSRTLLWSSALIVLGLLGWSVALKLEGPSPSASLETSVAPLAPSAPDVTSAPSATPPDVVETPSRSAPELAEASAPAATPEAPAPSPSAPVSSEPAAAAPAPLVPAASSAAAPSVAPSSAAAGSSVAVNLARPGALQQAVGAALAGHSAAPTPAAPVAPNAAQRANAAPSQAIRDDEFGIMAAGSSPPAAAAPQAPAAPPPAGAKSSGNVGDLARVGQPPASGARKEPGSESSAKGSLLVETPSF